MANFETQYDSSSCIEFIDNAVKSDTVHVFLHGIGSGAVSWINQLNAIQDSRIIAWNAPGYSRSIAIDKERPTALDYSARLYQLLETLSISRINIIGHSLGGLIASGFTSTYPEMVENFILANPAQGYGDFDKQKQEEIANLRPTLFQKLGGAKMARQRSDALMYLKNEENTKILEEVMDKITLSGYQKSSRLLAHDSIHNYLPKIQSDIHVIYGTKDGITKPDGMLELRDKYNKTILYPIDSAGHLSYLDQPEQFNKIIKIITSGDPL